MDGGSDGFGDGALPELVSPIGGSMAAAAYSATDAVPVTDTVHREAPKGFLVGVLPREGPTALEQVVEVAEVRGGGGGGIELSGGSFGGFGDEGKVLCAAACRYVEEL